MATVIWLKSYQAGYTFKNKWNGRGENITPTRPLQFARALINKGFATRMEILYKAGIITMGQYQKATFDPIARHKLRGQHCAVFAMLTKNKVITYDPKQKGYVTGVNFTQYIIEAGDELKMRGVGV